jgi:hypothetical protein
MDPKRRIVCLSIVEFIKNISKDIARRLLTATQTENQVQGALLLDVVVAQGAAVFQLLTSEDETLLVRRNTLLVLNLALHVVDSVAGLNLQSDSLASKSFDEDLHTTTETQDEMKCGLLLDVVIRKSTAVLKLLTSEDKTLLIRRNTLLILDLALHIINRIG